jgi:integrase/recombinase XerC
VSENFEKLITAFTRHLEVERSLSVHTIRAYIGDLESLLTHLETIGVTDISQLELVHLRSWLANQQVKGGSANHFVAQSGFSSFVYKVGGQKQVFS